MTGVLLASMLLTSSAPAQPVQAPVLVQTRLVQMYAEYEQQLLEAINRHNAKEMDRLVADDFEMITADHPGTATPRAAWMAQLLRPQNTFASIKDLVVHELGDVHIVSFGAGIIQGSRLLDLFFIDVWVRLGERSMLKTRYAARLGPETSPIPGDAPPEPFNKR
jgi:hypothetical protein